MIASKNKKNERGIEKGEIKKIPNKMFGIFI